MDNPRDHISPLIPVKISSDEDLISYQHDSLWIVGAFTTSLLIALAGFVLIGELSDAQRETSLPMWVLISMGAPPLIFAMMSRAQYVIDVKRGVMLDQLCFGSYQLTSKTVVELEEIVGVGTGVHVGRHGDLGYHLVFMMSDHQYIVWERSNLPHHSLDHFALYMASLLSIDHYPSYSLQELEDQEKQGELEEQEKQVEPEEMREQIEQGETVDIGDSSHTLFEVSSTIFDANVLIMFITGTPLALLCLGYYHYGP